MFREYYKNIIENFDLIIFNSSITKREFFKYINIDKKTKQKYYMLLIQA